MTSKSTEKKPRGRDEIVAAVVDVAGDLFARRGPAAVSLRDIAAAANVTLSQIHRHIGNKESLLVAVLDANLAAGDEFDPPTRHIDLETWLQSLFRLRFPPAGRARLQGRIILDGYDLPALQERFPSLEYTVGLLRPGLPEEDTRVRAALLASFLIGWQLFGEMYLRVTEAHEVTPERFSELVGPLIRALATAPPADA